MKVDESRLTKDEIRSIKAKELVIYREEDITATAVDEALIKAQVVKTKRELVRKLEALMKCLQSGGLFHIDELIEDEEWQALRKEE